MFQNVQADIGDVESLAGVRIVPGVENDKPQVQYLVKWKV